MSRGSHRNAVSVWVAAYVRVVLVRGLVSIREDTGVGRKHVPELTVGREIYHYLSPFTERVRDR